MPMRISFAVTPGALAPAATPVTAGAPSAGTHLVAGGRPAVWAAAVAARPSAPVRRADESRRRAVRRSIGYAPGVLAGATGPGADGTACEASVAGSQTRRTARSSAAASSTV